MPGKKNTKQEQMCPGSREIQEFDVCECDIA